MVDEQIMNLGWRYGGFQEPTQGALRPWHPQIGSGFNQLFDFRWARAGSGTFAHASSPLLHRERGVQDLGGTYEHIAIAYDPAEDAAEITAKVLRIGEANSAAPVEPQALNVTVHGGFHLGHGSAEHWVELYDPYAFERVHLTPAAFATLAARIRADVERELELALQRTTQHARRSEEDLDRWFYVKNFVEGRASTGKLTACALLLAGTFCAKRLPLTLLLRLQLELMGYEQAYGFVAALPEDERLLQVPFEKLLLLYGGR